MFMEGIEHQADGRQPHRLDELDAVRGGVGDVGLEAVERLDGEGDAGIARDLAGAAQAVDDAREPALPLGLLDRHRGAAGKDQRRAVERAADDAGAELARDAHAGFEIADAGLVSGGIGAGEVALEIDAGARATPRPLSASACRVSARSSSPGSGTSSSTKSQPAARARAKAPRCARVKGRA